MTAVNILSTRCVANSDKALFKASNCILTEVDFISINPIPFNLGAVYDAVLFTSQNAVKQVCNHPDLAFLKEKIAFCVGMNTKKALENAGWEVKAWAHYAKDLAPILSEQFPDISISFFNGSLRRALLPSVFQQEGRLFNEFKVYETHLTPIWITTPFDGLCFYSPSAIQSYLQLNTITDEVCFCIGDTTAEALKEVTQNIVLAEQPTVEATLQACVKYYQ